MRKGKIVIWQDEKYIKDTGSKEVYKYIPDGITWEYENDEDWLMTIDLANILPAQPTINASTVEGLREVMKLNIENIDKIRADWLSYRKGSGYDDEEGVPWIVANFVENKLLEQIDTFLTHASTLSDSTLLEVLVEVGEEYKIEKGVDELGRVEEPSKLMEISFYKGCNQERRRVREIINKKLEKKI